MIFGGRPNRPGGDFGNDYYIEYSPYAYYNYDYDYYDDGGFGDYR